MTLYCRVQILRPVGRLTSLLAVWIILVVTSPVLLHSAWADFPSRPFWTERAMFRFGDDIFFVGQSSCAPSAEVGRQRAFGQAMQELLNYAQSSNAFGLTPDTQMVFEETDSSGCPIGTVTVWRLLRIYAGRMASLTTRSPRRTRPEETRSASPPLPTTPSVGMSRQEVFDRFGLPASLTLRHDGEFVWEYRRLGFTVTFNRQMFVKRWTATGTHTREDENSPSPLRERARPSPAGKDTSIVDLTVRLRALEEAGQAPVPTPSSVYHDTVFARRRY